MGWRNRPEYIDKWPEGIDYTMFIDENGDSNLSFVKKQQKKGMAINDNDKYFSITGCVIGKEQFTSIRQQILDLKYKYWEDGKYNYGSVTKRVCFHSSEIRGRKGPFSENIIDYNAFIMSLSDFMEDLPTVIFSSIIDKDRHCRKYHDPIHPYNLCLDFILERFVKFYLKHNEKAIIILEARGKKEDKYILEHLKNLFDNGTSYAHPDLFKKIKGVYFNPKWCKKSNEQKSYFGLECSDLLSYPIYKYVKYGIKDKSFSTLENKIYGYPNYISYGLKKFP